MIDKEKTPTQLRREQIKEQLDSALKVMENEGRSWVEAERPESYKKHGISRMEELKSNIQLLDDIKKNDPLIFPLIEAYLNKGIPTCASCQGHPEEGRPKGYIGFHNLENPKTRDIINFVSIHNINSEITFKNKGFASDYECYIHWPAKETSQRVEELVNIINDKTVMIETKTPNIINLMEKLIYTCDKNDIGITIRRKGISSEHSEGEIELINHVKNKATNAQSEIYKKVVEIFSSQDFKTATRGWFHIIEWDKEIDDKKVCEIITKVIQLLEKNQSN